MTSEHDAPPGDRQMDLLLNAANRILRPVARLFLGRLPCDVAVKLLKLAYVEEGRKKLERESTGKRVTKSALALLIGLDTRVIGNLEKQAHAQIDLSRSLPYSSVLSKWVLSDEWRDPKTGQPGKLGIYGPGLTFQALVAKSIGKNISYQKVLDDLIREGNIALTDDGRNVVLRSNIYQALSPNEAITLKTGSLGINFTCRMVDHNAKLAEGESRWPAHIFWADHLPLARMPEVREKIHKLIAEHAEDYEQKLEPLAGQPSEDPTMTAGVELFYWEKPDN